MKIIRLIVASALIAFGLGVGTQPASAATGTGCSQSWYVHGAYRDASTSWYIWSWSTCVPNGTYTPNPPDLYLPGNALIVEEHVQGTNDGGAHYFDAGINYQGGGTLVPWQDTQIATASCFPGDLYRTWIGYKVGAVFYAGATAWHNIGC
jgi:hypothetical protein